MSDPALHLTLVGGPTLLVELDGLKLLTDPTFDPPGTHAARTPGAVPLTKTAGPAARGGGAGGRGAAEP
jgi:L-ascorbate metabolism protein UlaG (beta-lactamase superfamily)